MELTEEEAERQAVFRNFTAQHVRPYASAADRDGAVPEDMIAALADNDLLGAAIDRGFGGGGLDETSYGLLCDEIGRACSSTRSLLTVQNMVARTIQRWASSALKERWLPKLASGEAIAGFCLTEPEIGSDAAHVATTIAGAGETLAVTGRKRWVTFGARADVYLVLGMGEQGPTAVLVERDRTGVSIEPVGGLLGLRAARVADVEFHDTEIPVENVVGKPGVGFSHIVATTLDHGRYSVAWGCIGIASAALAESVDYALGREQFGAPIATHQLVRKMVAGMHVGVRSARLVCLAAGRLRDRRDSRAVQETILAKYLAARTAASATRDAVQIHGANGCGQDYNVERYFRDAKVMQIIEGTDQLLEVALSDFAYRGQAREGRR